MAQETKVLRKNSPQQMALDGFDAKFVKTLNNLAETIKVVSVGHFILNLLMSSSLNMLWSMINNQQLIVLMPCFDLQMPANVQIFFNEINQIASFDIINIDPLINRVLNLNETEPINHNFEAIGLQSIFFLNNMGSLMIGFFTYFIGLIVMICL
jgi:hypothetical protein